MASATTNKSSPAFGCSNRRETHRVVILTKVRIFSRVAATCTKVLTFVRMTYGLKISQPRHVPHLTARSGIPLAVEMQMRLGIGKQCHPILNRIAKKIVHGHSARGHRG